MCIRDRLNEDQNIDGILVQLPLPVHISEKKIINIKAIELNKIVRGFLLCTGNLISLTFFGIIFFGNELLSLPFSIFFTFVIEEKFGFNKTTIKTYISDRLKSWILTILFGGGVLSFIIFQEQLIGENFWIVAWMFVTGVTILLNGFYAQIIVPLFNTQSKLEDGELRTEIEKYSKKVGFNLSNIFVIDGSKRSSKANAYFSGFGKQKRVTLFDTLIDKLNKKQIVAVIAHEIGHYKKNHIIFNLFFSIIQTGIMLYILSLFIYMPVFSEALGICLLYTSDAADE